MYKRQVVKRVDGARGVGDRAGRDRAGLDGLIDRNADIAQIVQRVEDADDVDAVFDGKLDKLADNVVGIVLIAEEVLLSLIHI